MPIEMRSQNEIDEQMNKASDAAHTGSKWPGMSYEEGVITALEWACGLSDDEPMSDE